MTEPLTLMEGTAVECTDGSRARLERMLVDSTTRRLQHLAVEAPGGETRRLVPTSHLRQSAGHLALDCSSAELETFDHAEISRRIPDTMAAATGGEMRERIVLTHNVPDGEVEVLVGEEVRADNGHLGRLRGMLVDPEDGRIQQLLVVAGRFSKHELSVPASLITGFDGAAVHLAGSKRELVSRLAA